ncbi:uncharacterized protein ARMOST_19760 [Armillaria ostoyae]|uniref:Integrase catalytic domain-containing protein n=1 Tax=Armillaria ostoyae TaxID=47428 RepID=A0A284S5I0_ARMOS|nr:uncharacterized protein ARMOST_19760 [Armillaria ostoyae]
MEKDIKTYIGGCKTCQRTKSSNQAKSTPLHPNTIPTEPWTHISVDMITGLPSSNGHDALLVIVDRFSKAIILVPCNIELSAEGWARILRNHVYARHGMPQVVISDQGPQFVSTFMKELYQMLDIKQNASTAFHPQTDRQTECVNQEVEKYLRIFINHQQDDWADWLPLAEFTHNNHAHSATGKSPFMILYGQTGASAYKLKLPPHWKIHPHFNEKLLTPYIPPSFPNQEQPPPPPPLDLIDDEEQWELEEVLDSKTHRIRGKRGQLSTTVIDYFIKWKGWTREHNSWVTEKDMGNAKEAIAEYVKKTKCNERVAIVKIATTPKSPLAMIVNHHYSDNGDFSYLMQCKDRTQKWVLNPNVNKYKDFLEEYWASYHSSQEPPTMMEP